MERKAGYRVEEETLPRLVGCMTDAAGEVEFYLGDIDYPAHVTRFLRKMAYFSFKQAGFYRQRKYPNPGGWCFFTAEKWATLLRMDKSQVFHIRKRLVDDGIIFYQPNLTGERDLEGDVADGRLIWNLTFAEWKPLQGAPIPYNYGGSRQGAGRPRKKQPINANLNTEQASTDNLNSQQGGNANLISGSHVSTLQEEARIQRLPEVTSDAPTLAISKISSLHCTPGYFALDASSAGSADEAPPVAVINVETRKDVEENYSANALATAVARAPSSLADEVQEDQTPPSSTNLQQSEMFAGQRKDGPAATPPARPKSKGAGKPKPEPTAEEIALEARKKALEKIWLEHPNPRVIKPKYSSGWSAFKKGIKFLAEEDGITPEQQGPLIDAMLTWSKGTYQPTPMKMHNSLDEVESTLKQQKPRKGVNHAGRTEQAKRGDTSDQDIHTEIDKWGVISIYSTPRSPA